MASPFPFWPTPFGHPGWLETAWAETPRARPPEEHRRAPSLTRALSNILRGVGLGKTDTIRITGPSGLATLLWFCRHGYEHVGYVRAGRCPHEDGDLLLVPHTCTLDALKEILDHGPQPRPGGVLIVQTPAPCGDGPDPAHDLLSRGAIAWSDACTAVIAPCTSRAVSGRRTAT